MSNIMQLVLESNQINTYILAICRENRTFTGFFSMKGNSFTRENGAKFFFNKNNSKEPKPGLLITEKRILYIAILIFIILS